MRLKLSSILSALILTGIHASSQVSADSNPWEQAIAQMNTAAGTDSLNFWQWAWYWQRSPAFSSAPGGFGVLGSIDNTSGLMDKIVAMGGGNGFQIVSAEQWVLYYRQAVWAWYWARYPAFSGAPPGGFGVLGSIDNTHAIIQPSITAVANAASFIPGLAPGGIVTIFGTNLSNISGIIAADKTPLPTDLGGTQVIVSGFADSDGTTSAAALFSVANINGQEQINLQIPWHVVGLGCYISAPDGCDVSIVVINNGISSDRVVINTSIAQPGIFTVDGSTGLITQADTNQLVTKDAPAASGEVVSIYSTNLRDRFNC